MHKLSEFMGVSVIVGAIMAGCTAFDTIEQANSRHYEAQRQTTLSEVVQCRRNCPEGEPTMQCIDNNKNIPVCHAASVDLFMFMEQRRAHLRAACSQGDPAACIDYKATLGVP